MQSKAKNSLKAYACSFKKWSFFAQQNQNLVMPADNEAFYTFLLSGLESDWSWPVINGILSGVKFFHKVFGYLPPEDKLGGMFIQFLKKNSVKAGVNRNPFLRSDLERILHLDDIKACSFYDYRNLMIFVMGFFGFFRFSDMILLKKSGVFLREDGLCLKFFGAKTDQCKMGQKGFFSQEFFAFQICYFVFDSFLSKDSSSFFIMFCE